MNVTLSVDQVPINLVSFPSDIMVSLTTLVPWIQLKKISLGVPHLLMITTIMYQVEAIMEIVDQNVHCLILLVRNCSKIQDLFTSIFSVACFL